jgi:hypothetical protein
MRHIKKTITLIHSFMRFWWWNNHSSSFNPKILPVKKGRKLNIHIEWVEMCDSAWTTLLPTSNLPPQERSSK